ncbi:TPA: PAS domain S-box protein [Candidatus Poribacteria bacterium]|nr:PAS domain S-box protein [Candidatus Poribacteria bacterium]
MYPGWRTYDLSDFIIESIDTGVILLDEELRIVKWNSGMERLSGFSKDEVIGRKYFEVFPHLEPKFKDIIVRVMETRSPHEINHYEHHTLRRGPIVINRRIYPLKDEHDVVRGAVIITEDITEKALLEEQLRRKSQKLEIKVRELKTVIEIVNAMQSTYRLEAILYIILTGITAGKGLGYNRAMLFLMSEDFKWLEGKMGIGPIDREEGFRIWEQLHEDARSLQEMVLEYNGEIESSPLNLAVRSIRIPTDRTDSPLIKAMNERRVIKWDEKDTDEYLQKLNLTNFVVLPIFSYVEPLGVIVVDNIVTGQEIDEDSIDTLKLFATQVAMAIERSVLYQDLDRQIEKLKRANEEIRAAQEQLLYTERLATIGQMATSLAHEIRNPVSVIGGYARSVLKRMEDSDERRDFIQTIVEETDKLEELLRRNLDFIQPVKLKLKRHEISQIISTAISLVRRECEDKEVRIHLSLDETPAVIMADQYQLIYAIVQIVRNALQSMPQGGDIWVESKVSTEKGEVRIEISDTGCGMSKEVLKRAFDPFFTTDKLRSGLGLTMVRKIVEDHNGSIQLRSEEGKGTTAIILLPLTSEGESEGSHEERR